MKKTAIALFASLALVLGMGALGSTANAAYPNTVRTNIKAASKSVNEGSTFKVTAKVRAGNATVGGKVTAIFNGKKKTLPLSGGRATFFIKAPKVNKTKVKTLKFNFKPSKNSIYKASSTAVQVKIKNKKKKKK
ncbi:hypothetical protein [Aeromicrobium chenweiae]|uniref:Uncharacterized protein n=1 Tax=Aeromicrobium chenweiae TaxID=2079793 RepID=A0A2S0WHM7_9ACTN|nr:hypothetical protein [Aeromicrobium chenweiae]AWB90827.1 hypothetical protein C3E78_00465 [Aeromicrobium chenweiae]TGN31090.1 hypothetical protein E4L97_15935 [Aeromicrobium chenweiae]